MLEVGLKTGKQLMLDADDYYDWFSQPITTIRFSKITKKEYTLVDLNKLPKRVRNAMWKERYYMDWYKLEIEHKVIAEIPKDNISYIKRTK